MKKKILVVGLGLPSLDEQGELFYTVNSKQIYKHIENFDVLIAGKKQLELFPYFSGEKVAVTADVAGLLEKITKNRDKGLRQVALATGDPLCFGLGSTFISHFGHDSITIIPAIGSLQATASILGISPQDVACVSLHGPRDWSHFNRELLAKKPIFLLTDNKNNPGAIARYMLERGCSQYSMHILGGLYERESFIEAKENEVLSLEQASTWDVNDRKSLPRVVVLFPQEEENNKRSNQYFGLSDDIFSRSDNVMTKRSARTQALGLLGIAPDHIVWDLGAGVGSISIEASHLAYRGHVFAVEKEASRVQHILENRYRMGRANLEVIQGELPYCLSINNKTHECICSGVFLPRPDRIFIGGGCGIKENATCLLEKAFDALVDGGRLVIASVLLSTFEKGRNFFESNGITYEVFSIQSSEGKKLGTDMYMKAATPIQYIVGYK